SFQIYLEFRFLFCLLQRLENLPGKCICIREEEQKSKWNEKESRVRLNKEPDMLALSGEVNIGKKCISREDHCCYYKKPSTPKRFLFSVLCEVPRPSHWHSVNGFSWGFLFISFGRENANVTSFEFTS
ncbi:hypothetical protein M5D96_005630, partial [Drosophila gunungcola]